MAGAKRPRYDFDDSTDDDCRPNPPQPQPAKPADEPTGRRGWTSGATAASETSTSRSSSAQSARATSLAQAHARAESVSSTRSEIPAHDPSKRPSLGFRERTRAPGSIAPSQHFWDADALVRAIKNEEQPPYDVRKLPKVAGAPHPRVFVDPNTGMQFAVYPMTERRRHIQASDTATDKFTHLLFNEADRMHRVIVAAETSPLVAADRFVEFRATAKQLKQELTTGKQSSLDPASKISNISNAYRKLAALELVTPTFAELEDKKGRRAIFWGYASITIPTFEENKFTFVDTADEGGLGEPYTSKKAARQAACENLLGKILSHWTQL